MAPDQSHHFRQAHHNPNGANGGSNEAQEKLVRRIEKYEAILSKDPQSKVFAALAESYRELGQWDQAERWIQQGLPLHPDYPGGFLALGRLQLQKKEFEGALSSLRKVLEMSPDNLLAYELLGEAYLHLQRPQEALRAHKMALFLNPMSERSRRAVQKLESLSAQDYESDLFQLRKFTPALHSGFHLGASSSFLSTSTPPSASTPAPALARAPASASATSSTAASASAPTLFLSTTTPSAVPQGSSRSYSHQLSPAGFGSGSDPVHSMRELDLQRILSLMDAYIFRNELKRAREFWEQIPPEYLEHPDVLRRVELLSTVPVEPVELRASVVPVAVGVEGFGSSPLPSLGGKDLPRSRRDQVLQETIDCLQELQVRFARKSGIWDSQGAGEGFESE